MSEPQLERVLAELTDFLNQAAIAHAAATSGPHHLREDLSHAPTVPDNPDPEVYFGIGDPNLTDHRNYAHLSKFELLDLLRPDGPIEDLLGQQWVTHVFAHWEHYYRPTIAEAIGCEPDDVHHDLFGDLRCLRHDILHARGHATLDNAGRCIRLGHWVVIGQQIQIRNARIDEFMHMLPSVPLVVASGREGSPS